MSQDRVATSRNFSLDRVLARDERCAADPVGGLLQSKCVSDIIYDVRLVLDTDVVFAALRSPSGGSAALLRCLDDGMGTLLLSTTLLFEYEAICSLVEHRMVAGLGIEDVQVFLDGLAAMAEPVEIFFSWRPMLNDPDDEMVLEAAMNGGAHAIVTFNRRDFGDAPRRFGIAVLRPADALGSLRR